VEFDHDKVVDYARGKARALKSFIESQSTLVYEAHSTDYQSPASLNQLVHDHFAILKVGPGVTFALREAVWALDQIEREWLGEARSSRVRETLLNVMRVDPRHWQKYYDTQGDALTRQLQYSLSDRIRYYWPVPAVAAAVNQLLHNLDEDPPALSLLSQYLPNEYGAIRAGRLALRTRDLIMHHVGLVLTQYADACRL